MWDEGEGREQCVEEREREQCGEKEREKGAVCGEGREQCVERKGSSV